LRSCPETAIRDDVFGYMLHVIDIATNKVLAATDRREPCDVLSLLDRAFESSDEHVRRREHRPSSLKNRQRHAGTQLMR